MRTSLTRLLAIPLLGAALILGCAAPASAIVNDSDGPSGSGSVIAEDPANLAFHANGFTASSSAVESGCVSAARTAKASVNTAFCTATTTFTQGKTTLATAAALKADGITPSVSSTIWTYTWSENTRGVTWNEVHGGRTYFDHSHVWGRSLYRGYKGYHTCDIGGSYAVGYVIDISHCYTTPTLSTYRIQSYDVFKVTAGFHGIPISFTHSMHVNMYPSGSLYAH